MADQTERIPDLRGSRLAAAERRDPLDRWLQLDRLALFALSGVWALLTHRDWLRSADTLLAVSAFVSWLAAAIRARTLL